MSGSQDLDLQSIERELIAKAEKVTDINILFLDLSSNCTGYSLVQVNFEQKSANFINAGAIWFNKDWDNQEKYHYLYCAITNYFNIVGKIDYCVAEAYMINTKRMMGCQVGPELHGALQVSLAEIGVKYKTILPQTWRKALEIKKLNGDFKEPTREAVAKYITLPEQITSNITGTSRNTPHDLTDAIAISMAFLTRLNITKWNFKNIAIQESIDF
jgi:Holliday junction resolvasome RuvABC endonuclease subunit